MALVGEYSLFLRRLPVVIILISDAGNMQTCFLFHSSTECCPCDCLAVQFVAIVRLCIIYRVDVMLFIVGSAQYFLQFSTLQENVNSVFKLVRYFYYRLLCTHYVHLH